MSHWTTIWAQAHTDLHVIRSYLRGKTARTTIPVCTAGSKLRLRFSNREGRSYFVLRDATVCVGEKTYTLTFGGQPSLTLAPGKAAYCDEIECNITAGDAVSITTFYSRTATSGNQVRESTIYSTKGNFVHGDFVLGKGFYIVLFLCVPGLAGSVGVLVPVGVLIALGAGRVMYKKGWL